MADVKFRKPLDGTIICLTDDVIDKGAAVADCIIHAPAEHILTVNGVECTERNGAYFATVPNTVLEFPFFSILSNASFRL